MPAALLGIMGLFKGILVAAGLGYLVAEIRKGAPGERALDFAAEDEPVVQHNYEVNVGDHVFLEEGGEEVGAVRKVERDHLVVYIEAAGDFIVRGPEVLAIHYGKVILDPSRLDAQLLAAAQRAHERESDEAHAG